MAQAEEKLVRVKQFLEKLEQQIREVRAVLRGEKHEQQAG